jgi:hypothetical protein
MIVCGVIMFGAFTLVVSVCRKLSGCVSSDVYQELPNISALYLQQFN